MKGCVLSGGGASGCFTAGVIYRLFGEIKFSRVYGTSAGALNSALLAQAYIDKSPEIIKEVWTEIISKNRDVYKINYFKLLMAKAPISYNPLRKLISEIANFDAISKMDEEFVTTSVDLLSGRTNYVSNKVASPQVFKEALIASASVPFFTPAVELGSKTLVDGGIRENAPVRKMLSKKDINDILVVLTSPIEIDPVSLTYRKKYKNTFNVLMRMLNVMMGEITMNDFKNIKNINKLLKEMDRKQIKNNEWLKNKEIVNVNMIVPNRVIIDDLLKFDQDSLRRGFELGEREARNYLRYGPKEINDISLKRL